MSFWDVCDLHLNLSYQSIGNDTYGDFKRDAPISLIKSAFIFMKMTYSHPDFILVNGDNVYHGENNFTEILQTVSFTIRDEFPLTTVLPTLGNHDVQPRNIFAVNSTWCVQLFDFWKTFLVSLNTSDINSFKKGCFYSQTIDSPKNYTVLVIVLNTLVWYSRNQIDESIEDPLGQFSWLEEKLQYARKSQTKVFIAGHVPPGASEYSTRLIEHLLPKYNERFLTILQKYSDIIAAGFFAHQHTDAFKIVYNDKDITGNKSVCKNSQNNIEWEIKTKYYDTKVSIDVMVHSDFTNNGLNVKYPAIALISEGNNNEITDKMWKQLSQNSDIRLLINCESEVNAEVQDWCLKNDFELIELNETICDEALEDEIWGWRRVKSALEAHDWCNLVSDSPSDEEKNEDQFEQLFEQLGDIKALLEGANESDRRKLAEEVTLKFWRSIGGSDSELNDL